MSAISLATLGVICDARAVSMATIGVICGDVLPIVDPTPPIPGSGGGRTGLGYTGGREDALKETRRRKILQEDEEIVALIMAMVSERLI